jgi:Zn-finger nucleic acid-binding protein
MNCANCGAAMALAESRRHLRCGHCGSLRFNDAPEADGIRIVGRTADAPACPVCRLQMDAAVLDDCDPIHFCGGCRGVLLARPVFAATVSRRRAWATGPPASPIPFDRRSLDRKLACPSCGGSLETYPHSGPGNVVIDSCVSCDLIWLDFGEMRQVVDAPGRDRGTQLITPTDDTYVRKGPPRSQERIDEPDPPKGLFEILFEF